MKMVMPKMGMTMEEGTIVEWKKKNGEYVKKGEVILEIMTNKVNIDVEAPDSGYLKIMRGPDEIVPVGEVIALVKESPPEPEVPSKPKPAEPEKTDISVKKPEIAPEQKAAPAELESARIPSSPRARRLAEEKGIPLEKIRGTGPEGAVTEKDVLRRLERGLKGERVAAAPQTGKPPPQAVSPLAERIARDKGIDVSQVKGTGLGGKITKNDILRFIEGLERKGAEKVPESEIKAPPGAEAAARKHEPPSEIKPAPEAKAESEIISELAEVVEKRGAEPDEEIFTPVEPQKTAGESKAVPVQVQEGKSIPLTGIKKVTAQRMSKSKREAPHLTLEMEVDMTEASKLKTSLSITYTDIFVKAVATALAHHPMMNSVFAEDKIVQRDDINIGVAVAREEDLLVPVIHNADQHSLKKISQICSDIIERTRNNQLDEKDVLDGTFTISNLGMYDIDFFTPIINPPEAAILGVGRIAEKPVVVQGKIQIRERTTLSLSFDHRIVNGVPAALFLKDIRNLLEHPYKLLVEGES